MEKQSLTATNLWHRMGLLQQPWRSRGGNGLSGLTLAAMLLTSQSVSAADLTAWNYDPTTQQLEVTAKAGIQPKYFVMAQPARIVLDLPDTEMGDVKPRASFTGGAIRQVRVSQFQPGVTRVVLELAPDVQLAPGQVKLEAKGDRWVLRPLIAGQSTTAAQSTPIKTAAAPAPSQAIPGEPNPPTAPTATAVPLAIGADISPVTSEPPVPPQVAVPPLSTSPAPVAVPPLTTAPVPPPTPARTPNLPPLAQLPPEATTPLPPETELPSSRLSQEGNNSITISVPPPVPLPVATSEAVVPANTPAAVQPITLPTTAANLGNPTPARSPATAPVSPLSVPTLQPAPLTQTLPPSSVTPLPPMAVPSIAPVTVPTAPGPTMQPGGRIITTKGGQPASTIQTQQVLPGSSSALPGSSLALPGSVSVPTTTAPAGVKQQPPNSWVMQSSGLPQPVPVNVPPASVTPPASRPPATMTPTAAARNSGQPMMAPNSWVMQSSGLPQPSLVKPLPQPPVSSVIQPAIAAMPMPAPSVIPPLQGPMAVNPAGMPSTVAVPPLTPAPLPPTAMPSVAVPPLSTPTLQPSTLPAPVNPASVVEFGQPLPTQRATALNTMPVGLPGSTIAANSGVSNAQIVPPAQTGVAQSINPAIALPAGTVLALAYPGVTELKVDPANPRQEMLVLQTEVRDASGNVVFPRGSYVIGRFEAGQGGTQFMTSAIQRGDRIVPFLATSDPLSGGREISPTSMALYSGAGLLAGGLVSGFSGWGMLLGGAAGAATNYLTAPKPTGTVQPGQVIPIRMLQDIPF